MVSHCEQQVSFGKQLLSYLSLNYNVYPEGATLVHVCILQVYLLQFIPNSHLTSLKRPNNLEPLILRSFPISNTLPKEAEGICACTEYFQEHSLPNYTVL